jgi:hypothetical protein
MFLQIVKNKFWFSFQYTLVKEAYVFVCDFRKLKRVFVRACALISTLFPIGAIAANGVYMPPPPMGVGGEDSITTGTGTHCRSSMNSNKGYVDVGLTGSQGTANDVLIGYQPGRQDTATVYARVIIPLGASPKKIDCSRFMELEIERLEAEIKMLKYAPD